MENRKVLGEHIDILQERKKYWPAEWHVYNIDGQEYKFKCQYYEVSGSNQASLWGHEVTFMKSYYPLSTGKCCYYNRTWETWKFQTCMLQALSNYMKTVENCLYTKERDNNNVRSLSKATKEQLLADNDEYQKLQKLYKMISDGDKGEVSEN